ncbi:MAG TPA: DAHL domain-containing protein [Albitalea sp.]|uniref:DAHL domain-containing protein n=1 Tax=Piscinibacter sp. TaxID=1903157 RepID=UPI002ED08D5B
MSIQFKIGSRGIGSGVAVPALLLAALVAGWLYLYTHSHAVNADAQSEVLAMLKDLKQMDSDWSANVLRSHTDINLDYDALTEPLRPFADGLSGLKERVQPLANPAVDAALDDIGKALAAKTALIDAFKAQNSLFKNSLRYVPTAHREIQSQMRSERDAVVSAQAAASRETTHAFDELEKSVAATGKPEAGERTRQRMEQALAAMRRRVRGTGADSAARNSVVMMNFDANVSLLVDEALRYSSVPDRETAEAIRGGIERMRAATHLYPTSVHEPLGNLLSHLETLLRLRSKQAELLREISQVPMAARIDALSGLLTERFGAELAGQFAYQRFLLAYSAFALLLVAGGTAFILYRQATERQRLAALVEQQTMALKENEVQLVHAQRMAAIGEMVAGVAHEVNTPLAAVKSSLQSARELLAGVREHFDETGRFVEMVTQPRSADEALRAARKLLLTEQYKTVAALRREIDDFDSLGTMDQLMDDGVHGVEHIYSVVVNMLNFSRLDRTKIVSGKVEEGIDATLGIAKHLLGSTAVHKHYGHTEPIHCDIAQINQVVLNLVKNAAQALPETGGEIHISTSMASPSQVRIDVRDNGSGIPAEVLPNIWKPFFTTKAEGVGTGLGLSTCHKIVTAHGGRMAVESQPGRGTTFSVILPLKPPLSLYETHGQQQGGQLVVA